MTFRKSLLLLLSLSMIAALVACSNSSKPAITVTLSTPPPATLGLGTIAPIAAATNDTDGVTWSCAPVNVCGSFNSPTSLNDASINYTAPLTTGTITITATSYTNTAVSASATVSVGLTPGNYVFSMRGTDSDNSFYSVSGVFTVASDGLTISGGEQDFVDYYYVANDTSLTGTIASPGDAAGNVTITLQTGDANINPSSNSGAGGQETLVATMASSSNALIAENDAWASSNGTLDFQAATTLPTTACATTPTPCGYAFVLAGLDPSGDPLAIGGVLTEDGNGTISGTNSIFDANDSGNTTDGPLFPGETFGASTVTVPDTNGRFEFELAPTDTTDFNDSINLVGYIVDGSRIRLVETTDTFVGTTGGTALSQGSNTGQFSSSSIYSNGTGNSYVVGLTGSDTAGVLQVAGLLTAGSTSFTGFIDFNDLTGSETTIPDPITSETYTVASTGDVTIPGITDGTTTFNLQLYLDGNGNALAISMDTGDVLVGRGYQQTAPTDGFVAGNFSGTYAMSADGVDATNGYYFAAIGAITADGTSALTGGTADVNWFDGAGYTGVQTPDVAVTGTFNASVATGAAGIFTGTITGLDQDSCSTTCSTDAFDFYLIDSSGDNIAIETDANQLTLGYFQLQQ